MCGIITNYKTTINTQHCQNTALVCAGPGSRLIDYILHLQTKLNVFSFTFIACNKLLSEPSTSPCWSRVLLSSFETQTPIR